MSKTIYLFRHSEPADVYSSPYLRAVQTAEAFGMKVSVDDRLHERTIGRPEAFTKDLWELPYHDRALKLAGGESFLEAGRRMRLAMTDILSGLRNGQSAVVVSHAAAICAYLMEFASCEVTVMDADTKSRKVVFHGKKIHEGPIPAPSYFVMMFEDGELADLDYHAR